MFSPPNIVIGINDEQVIYIYIIMDLGTAFPRGPIEDFTENL